MNQQPSIGNRFILYNFPAVFESADIEECIVADTPATCLKKITEKKCGYLVLFMDPGVLEERMSLVNLCSILKTNRQTCHIPVLCVLRSRHRRVLEQLKNAGVEYARFYDPGASADEALFKPALAAPSEGCKIEDRLSEICPHITYFPVRQNHEIIYCGAYRNRLVLGTHRLTQSCETPNHLNCQIFKCPKIF